MKTFGHHLLEWCNFRKLVTEKLYCPGCAEEASEGESGLAIRVLLPPHLSGLLNTTLLTRIMSLLKRRMQPLRLGNKTRLAIWIDRPHEFSTLNSFNVYGIPRTVGRCNRRSVGADNSCHLSLSTIRTGWCASQYQDRNERISPICQQDNSGVKSQEGEGGICSFKNVSIVPCIG